MGGAVPKGDGMKRILATIAICALGLFPASASAKHGASNFPEQPGGHVARGCEEVLENVLLGTGGQQANPVAQQHAVAMFADACLE